MKDISFIEKVTYKPERINPDDIIRIATKLGIAI